VLLSQTCEDALCQHVGSDHETGGRSRCVGQSPRFVLSLRSRRSGSARTARPWSEWKPCGRPDPAGSASRRSTARCSFPPEGVVLAQIPAGPAGSDAHAVPALLATLNVWEPVVSGDWYGPLAPWEDPGGLRRVFPGDPSIAKPNE
jgi:hypothetical protein